jgi:hypothetical protein
MKRILLSVLSIFALACAGSAVELVKDGASVSEIVIAEKAMPWIKTAAEELQTQIKKMSGAELPIVNKVSPSVKNQIYVGESEYTGKLGFTLVDVKYDGFKIVADKNHVIAAGKDINNAEKFAMFQNVPKSNLQKTWEEYCGQKWRFPPLHDYRDFSKECGFDLADGTGSLYAVYELLEQLGFRWYMPVPEIGMVVPEKKNISIPDQNTKKEPEFPQRIFTDNGLGTFKNEFLWNKSMRVGTAFVMPVYHSLSGLMMRRGKGQEEQPPEYYGTVNGKTDYAVPNLNNEKLRTDFIKYLEAVDKAFPSDYVCIGQPDGWILMDSSDAKAGWNKESERGYNGKFSDYFWDFAMDIRKLYMEKHPDKKFTIFAYSGTRRPPTNIEKVPDNVSVVFCEASGMRWMLPTDGEQSDRQEWLKKLDNKEQLLIWEWYTQHAERFNFPPIPVIYTRIMKDNFKELYGRALGFLVEISYAPKKEVDQFQLIFRRPGISHMMHYLHSKLCWDRNLDVAALMDEYYELFFGPAKVEMKEFYEFSESVWMRPEPREITAAGGFLKKADIDRYFEILDNAKKKAGDSIYGRRIDYMAKEMEPLKIIFYNLQRKGPDILCHSERDNIVIDGNIDEPTWGKRLGFYPLRDSVSGNKPKDIKTNVAFRWNPITKSLTMAVECMEPQMDKVKESCTANDSKAIFSDDFVQIDMETPQGKRPLIAINPSGKVYDACIIDVEDQPEFYKVPKVSVKKYSDKWVIELQIDVNTLLADAPSKFYPWGINVSRQRLAGTVPEYYMLSPSGSTKFKSMESMGNLMLRK